MGSNMNESAITTIKVNFCFSSSRLRFLIKYGIGQHFNHLKPLNIIHRQQQSHVHNSIKTGKKKIIQLSTNYIENILQQRSFLLSMNFGELCATVWVSFQVCDDGPFCHVAVFWHFSVHILNDLLVLESSIFLRCFQNQ